MSFIGDILNPAKGAGFQAQAAQLQTPVTTEQATQAYNQSNQALQQQQSFINALQGAGGVQNQMAAMEMLKQQAAGQGPNPALAQLQAQTGQNVANQAALMAGQRGGGANAGLMARQIAQQGAATQQQSAGQAAQLQAAQQQQAQQAMAQLASQQVGQQAQAQGQMIQGTQGLQQNLLSGIQGQNQAQISNVSQQNQANAQMAGQNARTQSGIFGGLANAAGAAIAGPLGSMVGGALNNLLSPAPQIQSAGGSNSGGGLAPQMTAGGYASGGIVQHLRNFQSGGQVAGKATVQGDSPSNDTVPAVLSPGEIVIPRSIAQSKDAPKKAAAFVAALMAKKGLK